MTRRHYGREVWDRAGKSVETIDQLPVYSCGDWTIEKLFFLCQYLAQFTQAMVGGTKFTACNYVDLFCGNGVCEVDMHGRARRYPGSAMLAACCTKPFTNLFLSDSNPDNVDACITRIEALKSKCAVHSWVGDANALVNKIADEIPQRSLTVAFLDPFSLHIRFEAVKTLAERRPLDLLILMADGMDIVRNVQEYYYPRKSPLLDEFLGTEEWRADWDQLQNRDGPHTRAMFAHVYLRQLAKLGYVHSRTRPINGDTGPIYRLVYASKNKLGLKFWDIAESEDLHGNKSLFPP